METRKTSTEIHFLWNFRKWKSTEIFTLWFEKFVNITTQRALLLIFDGHLTHVSVAVIEKAMKVNFFIIKVSPYVTDILQPLDVASIGPLKMKMGKSIKFND